MYGTPSSTIHQFILTCGLIACGAALLANSCAIAGRASYEVGGESSLLSEGTSRKIEVDHLRESGYAAHLKLVNETGPYVSAAECGECHPKHYEEWRVSPHAYAQISPIFNAMHATILKRTNGSNGDFCIRCHTPVGMDMGEPLHDSNMNRSIVSVEGITCIVCHRVASNYGKISSRFPIEKEKVGDRPGDIFAPIYGPRGNDSFRRTVVESHNLFKISPTGAGQRDVHSEIRQAEHITKSGFCGVCHDVTLMNGFRLEEAFSEYKTSPAAANGISCQDCHMGRTPGVPDKQRLKGEPIAEVYDREFFKEEGRSNHMFIGPDYSVVHPGIFPHPPLDYYPKGVRNISMRNWLDFDWLARWGEEDFEEHLPEDEAEDFPETWREPDDRYEASSILMANLELLERAQLERIELLKAGYKLGNIVTTQADDNGIRFKIRVENGTNGHGVPTGFDAERVVFLHVTVTDRDGTKIMQSGDLDPNGDVRDLHSVYVHNHAKLPNGKHVELDSQLFSLQSRFITRNVRGGEREQILAVNTSLTPLPFVRPSTMSTILTGQPFGARKHKQNIAPGDGRWAHYSVRAAELTGKGPYTAEVKLVAGMVPVNLVNEIKEVGFDYLMSPRDVANNVVHGIGAPDDFDPQNFAFNAKYGGFTALHTRTVTFHMHTLPTSVDTAH
ncbi:MAG: multiheme c-type cytochrome [Phycisphaerae bacterium]